MAIGLVYTNLANKLLTAVSGTAFSNASCWVQLHTADPSSTGTNAVSAGSTARYQALTTNLTVTGGALTIGSNLTPWTNGGTSETVSYISVWTASTGANCLWTAQLTTAKAWVSADTLTLTALGISLAPIAA